MTKIVLGKVVKELKLVTVVLHLGIGGHRDRLTKLFGGHKPCYDGQWPLTSCYFKRCIRCTVYTLSLHIFSYHFAWLFQAYGRANQSFFFFSRKILILHSLFEHFLWKVTKITVTYVAEIRTQELKRQYNSFNYKSNVQTLCGTQIMHLEELQFMFGSRYFFWNL